MTEIQRKIKFLNSYEGLNPCPIDFAKYWDESIAELDLIEKKVDYQKAKCQFPNFECVDMFFVGIGNAKIHARMVKPLRITEKIPAIIKFHGYSSRAGDWLKLVSFAALGYLVVEMDSRGQAGESEDVGGRYNNTLDGHIIKGLNCQNPKDMFFRQVYLDAVELAKIVLSLPYVDEKKVYTYGGSQGGGLALASAALEPRISKTAVIYPYMSDFQKGYELGAYPEIHKYFKNYDPRHEKENEIFTKLGYLDIQNMMKWIKADVLLISALSDTICPPETQFAAYNKIKSNKQVIFYPDYGHDMLLESDELIMQFFVGNST